MVPRVTYTLQAAKAGRRFRIDRARRHLPGHQRLDLFDGVEGLMLDRFRREAGSMRRGNHIGPAGQKQ